MKFKEWALLSISILVMSACDDGKEGFPEYESKPELVASIDFTIEPSDVSYRSSQVWVYKYSTASLTTDVVIPGESYSINGSYDATDYEYGDLIEYDTYSYKCYIDGVQCDNFLPATDGSNGQIEYGIAGVQISYDIVSDNGRRKMISLRPVVHFPESLTSTVVLTIDVINTKRGMYVD